MDGKSDPSLRSQAPTPATPVAVGVPRLMLVTDRTLVEEGALPDVVAAAVEGGVDAVQVREKNLGDDELLALVRAIVHAVDGRAIVLVNGRPGVARAAGVGLHLPEDAELSGLACEATAERASLPHPAPAGDRPPRYSRTATVVPENQPPRDSRGAEAESPRGWLLWGRSVHSAAAAAAAAGEGADYLVAGPLFATTSHPGAPALGATGFREIVAAAGGVPVLAIGGITPGRVREAIAAGAAGVAVRSDVLSAREPHEAARLLLTELATVLAETR